MGCDGGTIPKRCELVPEKPKKERKDKNMSRIAKWTTCALSNRKLAIPVVSCKKGLLFNKDAVIEHILSKKKCRKFTYIKKLKDVKELNISVNPLYKESSLADNQVEIISQFICPITNTEMNGKYQFIYFWNCGCVISKRAFDEIKTSTCVICSSPYTPEDVIHINPIEKEEDKEESEDVKTLHEIKSLKKVAKNENTKKQKNKLQIECSTKEKKESTQNDKPELNLLNPRNSSVYKSLFTSSDAYKYKSNDKKAFWVSTFNYSV